MLAMTIEMSEASVFLEIDRFLCNLARNCVMFGNWLLAGSLLVNPSKIEIRDCPYRSVHVLLSLFRKLALHSLYWMWLFLT